MTPVSKGTDVRFSRDAGWVLLRLFALDVWGIDDGFEQVEESAANLHFILIRVALVWL